MASFEFDVATAPTNTSNFDPVPEGKYTVRISGAELKSTKDGSGQYIKVEYTIAGPSCEGRKLWQNYNVRNASAKAEEIGRAQLAELCRAIGTPRLGDTDELVGNAIEIKVRIRPARDQYEASNEVKSHKSLDGAEPPPVATASAPGPKKAAPPWAKK